MIAFLATLVEAAESSPAPTGSSLFSTLMEVLWTDASREITLLWLALALWVLLVLIRPTASLVLRQSEGGRLAISRQALHRLLEACAEQLKGVAHARAHVRKSGGKFHTTLHLKVRPYAKLDAIQGYLEQEINDIYRQNLGLPDAAGRVEVKVVGVVPEAKSF
jgi:hypothetical protein